MNERYLYENKRSKYRNVCPFCESICEAYTGNNIICACGAKFYWTNKVWLNRNTGEEIWEGKGVEGKTISIPKWTYKESEVAERREDIENSPADCSTPSVTDSKGERNEQVY